MAINTRVFGTPIKGTVKAKLEQRQQDAFLQAAVQLGIRLTPPVQLSGVNISKGQNVIIFLYSAEMFDANASKE